MLAGGKANDHHAEPIPLAALRQTLSAYRRELAVATVGVLFVALILPRLAPVGAGAGLPVAISVVGLIWFQLRSLALERDLRRARVRALDAIDAERERI